MAKPSTGEGIALGIDIGTSGVRAAVLDGDGTTVGFAAASFADASQTRDPSAWWLGVRTCLRELAGKGNLASVAGVAVDGTSGTIVGIDAAGDPVGEALLYNDVCTDPAAVESVAKAAPPTSPARGATGPLARAMVLARRPGVVHVVHQADWVAMRLGSGEPVSDENNSLKTGYDLRAEAWPEWIEAAGLPRALLPRVVRAGSSVGLVGAAGKSLGLPSSCRIHAGTTDGCAAFLATGASQIGDGVTSLGSTLVLKLACASPIDAPAYGIYSHRIGKFWLAGGASNTGGAVLRALVGDERIGELTLRLDPDKPTGLDYYPLVKPGERFPINDPAWPPRLTPRPSDDAAYFQGMLEGIAEIERFGFARLEDFGAPALASMRTVGGGTRNPAWRRIRERKLGVPFFEPLSGEASAGAAMLVVNGRR